jgi:hypothetical protein
MLGDGLAVALRPPLLHHSMQHRIGAHTKQVCSVGTRGAQMNQIRRATGFGAVSFALGGAFAGCGGDDEGSRGGSFTSIASAIESPSGTVDETTAPEVGTEFEKVSQVSLAGGTRKDAQTAQSSSGTQSCPEGGSFNVEGSGNQSSGEATVSYDDCCFIEDCCFDGNAEMYFSSGDGAAEYTYCASYDLDYSCEGDSATISFEGCFGTMGQLIYVIEVEGETYSVSGNYSGGSGMLEIRGANGTWNCTYSNGGGSCSGSGGSFTF